MSTSGTKPNLELLLADASTGKPLLTEGLPADAILSAPRPTRAQGARDGITLDAPAADPGDLAKQRWGVIIPAGPEGDQLLKATEDLIALREDEQGAKAIVYRVNPSMTAHEAAAWREREYLADDVPEPERPRYLLILGGLNQVSLELQQVLAAGSFVGRLHFDDPSGYGAYAHKVRRYAERASGHEAADALFYAARDPSMTTIAGYKQLIKPCAEAAASWKRSGKLAAENIVEVTRWGAKIEDFLGPASGERPAVLLSSSHGIGVDRGEPPQKRRALQGALTLGTAGILSAETLSFARFLPGGMWLCVACFGAGTPADSAYAAWLSALSQSGAALGALSAVLKSLPGPGEPPFVAALPQSALASPEGPLGVIAHMDLAWSYSFLSTETFAEGRASRIFSAIRVLLEGGRAGVALDALMRFYRAANDDLMAGYQAQENARVFGHADPTDPWRRGHTWMLRNDLRGYVLLGDPAAQIALRKNEVKRPARPGVAAAKAPTSPPPAITSEPPAPLAKNDAARESAVLALLRGDEPPRAIAARCGIPLEALWSWLETYRAAGRQALSQTAPKPRKIRSSRPI